MGFLNWFTDLAPGLKQDEVAGNVEAKQAAEAGLVRRDDQFVGTDKPVLDKDGMQQQRTIDGTEDHSQSYWSWITNTAKRIAGTTTTTTDTNEAGQVQTTTDVDKKQTEIDPFKLSAKGDSEQGSTVKQYDHTATVAAAKRQLEELKKNSDHDPAKQAKIDEDLAALGKGVDRRSLEAICNQHGLEVKDVNATASSTSEKSKWAVDAYRGNASAGTTKQDAALDAATGKTTTTTQTNDVKATAGRGEAALTFGDGNSSATTDATGKTVDGNARSGNVSMGVVANAAKGTGVTLGDSDTQSSTKNDVTTAKSTTSSMALTDRGAFASQAATASQTSGKDTGLQTTKTAKLSADIGFTVDITPIRGTTPQQYKVVLTLSDTLGAQLSAGKKRGEKQSADAKATTGSATASGSVGVQLVYSHVMGEAEARAYMANADAAQKPGAAPAAPEFDAISKVKALIGEGKDAAFGAAAVFGSAAASTHLADGESTELTISADAKLGGSGASGNAAVGGSLGAEGSVGGSRTIKVERTALADAHGKHMNDITVTFVTKRDGKVNASGTFEGVTAGAAVAAGETATNAAMVRLDVDAADYVAKYRQVCAATSVEEVRALATALTHGESHTNSASASIGAAGITGTVGVAHEQKESVTRDLADKRVLGSVAGSETLTGSVSYGAGENAVKLGQASIKTGATTTTDRGEGGGEMMIEQERAETDTKRSAKDGAKDAGAFLAKDKKDKDLAALVTLTPAERVKAQLETMYSEFEQYRLAKADVETLAARATDTLTWAKCCTSLRLLHPWEALGAQLAQPSLKADEAAIDAHDATLLARGRAMAGWISSQGGHGMELVVMALRHWGQNGGSLSHGKDLGVHLEWPNSLTAAKSKYELGHSRARTADDYLHRLVGDPSAHGKGDAWVKDTKKLLQGARDAIATNQDFAHPGARLEMLDAINVSQTQIDLAWRRTEPLLHDKPATAELAAVPAAPTHAVDATEQAKQDGWRRVSELHVLLLNYKSEETRQFNRVRSMMPESKGGFLKDGWFGERGDFEAKGAICREIGDDLHKGWIAHVLELRAMYRQLGVPAKSWVISHTGGDVRNKEYEADMATLFKLATAAWTTTQEHMATGYRQQAGAWTARWNGY